MDGRDDGRLRVGEGREDGIEVELVLQDPIDAFGDGVLIAGVAIRHACQHVRGDMVAIMGENRKLLLFPLEEIPEITRGQGVILQRYKDAGLSDILTFNLADGLSWSLGTRTRVETNLTTWIGKRGSAGKFPPVGFPRTNKFRDRLSAIKE